MTHICGVCYKSIGQRRSVGQKFSLADECTNKVWYIHARKHGSAIKKNEITDTEFPLRRDNNVLNVIVAMIACLRDCVKTH